MSRRRLALGLLGAAALAGAVTAWGRRSATRPASDPALESQADLAGSLLRSLAEELHVLERIEEARLHWSGASIPLADPPEGPSEPPQPGADPEAAKQRLHWRLFEHLYRTRRLAGAQVRALAVVDTKAETPAERVVVGAGDLRALQAGGAFVVTAAQTEGREYREAEGGRWLLVTRRIRDRFKGEGFVGGWTAVLILDPTAPPPATGPGPGDGRGALPAALLGALAEEYYVLQGVERYRTGKVGLEEDKKAGVPTDPGLARAVEADYKEAMRLLAARFEEHLATGAEAAGARCVRLAVLSTAPTDLGLPVAAGSTDPLRATTDPRPFSAEGVAERLLVTQGDAGAVPVAETRIDVLDRFSKYGGPLPWQAAVWLRRDP